MYHRPLRCPGPVSHQNRHCCKLVTNDSQALGPGPLHDSQPNDGKPSALVVPKFGPSEDTDPTFRNASRMASVIYRPTTPDAQSPKGTPVGYREWEWVEEMSLDSSANDGGDDDTDNFVVIR